MRRSHLNGEFVVRGTKEGYHMGLGLVGRDCTSSRRRATMQITRLGYYGRRCHLRGLLARFHARTVGGAWWSAFHRPKPTLAS